MGMFDTVLWKRPLPPVLFDPGTDFQTKSFAYPAMDVYTIKADGTLWKTAQLHWSEEDEAAFVPHMVPFSGAVNFYNTTTLAKDVEFEALLDGGRLVWVKVLLHGEAVLKMHAKERE